MTTISDTQQLANVLDSIGRIAVPAVVILCAVWMAFQMWQVWPKKNELPPNPPEAKDRPRIFRCRTCRGKGCKVCDNHGKVSLEDYHRW